MKIFGFEIKKVKDYPAIDDQEFISFIENAHTLCNNQLRGKINEKAKEYNGEILEYYFSQIMERAINFGVELEQNKKLNDKIQP